MFIFGTDGDTLRAWPIHTVNFVSYHPKGSAKGGGKPELSVHLANDTVVWLRGEEAEAVWSRIRSQGYGLDVPRA